jgi:hypothetical protein
MSRILPGAQPAIMDRALFDAVQQKALGSVDYPIQDADDAIIQSGRPMLPE